MTKNALQAACLAFADSYEDYPFDANWLALRRRSNKKTFAFIYTREGRDCVNLKCDPMRADFLRRVYTGLTPAYHMNKTHWNTVALESDVPDDELLALLTHSYELTRPKIRAPRKSEDIQSDT